MAIELPAPVGTVLTSAPEILTALSSQSSVTDHCHISITYCRTCNGARMRCMADATPLKGAKAVGIAYIST
eukprot:scaffold280716_cov32-Prasinocladus_malaysianus.AAC.1